MFLRQAPFTRLAVLAAALVGLSACATFTDDNVVARVGDAELSQHQFESETESLPEAGGSTITGDAARGLINQWIYLEASRAVGFIERYEQGPEASGVACINVLVAADSAAATKAVERLRAGDPASAVAADTDATATGAGARGCAPSADLGPEANAQLKGWSAADPHRVVELAPNFYVVSLQSTDQLQATELLTTLQAIDPNVVTEVVGFVQDSDIYVDPRFGAFDFESGSVVALG